MIIAKLEVSAVLIHDLGGSAYYYNDFPADGRKVSWRAGALFSFVRHLWISSGCALVTSELMPQQKDGHHEQDLHLGAQLGCTWGSRVLGPPFHRSQMGPGQWGLVLKIVLVAMKALQDTWFSPEVLKLWLMSQSSHCFCLARKTRMAFLFLNGWKKNKKKMIFWDLRKLYKFKFQYPQMKLCWHTAMLICLHIDCICFWPTVAELRSCDRCHKTSNIFLSPFTGKCCQPLD